MNFLESLEKRILTIDTSLEVELYSRVEKSSTKEEVQIVIPSKLLEESALELITLCVQSIKKFTRVPYTLWIVDNNSTLELAEQLLDIENVNIIFSRTPNPKKDNNSYENAMGIEIARKLIPNATKYLMTLHQDTVATKAGWLTYLLSKFDEKTKAVGFREDTARVQSGILHVLGYVVDYETVESLKLTYFPKLPDFDVGDKVIYDLGKAGYDYFATPNSIWQPELVEDLPEDSPFRDIQVDRAFDEKGDVIFMHLGRGVLKSIQDISTEGKTTIEVWSEFIREFIL